MKIEVKAEETRCDRCDKRIVKPRPKVCVMPVGVVEMVDGLTGPNEIDLCGPCMDSLSKWWDRKAVEK